MILSQVHYFKNVWIISIITMLSGYTVMLKYTACRHAVCITFTQMLQVFRKLALFGLLRSVLQRLLVNQSHGRMYRVWRSINFISSSMFFVITYYCALGHHLLSVVYCYGLRIIFVHAILLFFYLIFYYLDFIFHFLIVYLFCFLTAVL